MDCEHQRESLSKVQVKCSAGVSDGYPERLPVAYQRRPDRRRFPVPHEFTEIEFDDHVHPTVASKVCSDKWPSSLVCPLTATIGMGTIRLSRCRCPRQVSRR